jgi:hypothetical protein
MGLRCLLANNTPLWFLIICLIILLPFFGLFLSLFVWRLIPYFRGFVSFESSLLVLFLCGTGFRVYSVMIVGWSSNSNYSLLGGGGGGGGGGRGVSVCGSEASLALILFIFHFSYNLVNLYCFPILERCLLIINIT